MMIFTPVVGPPGLHGFETRCIAAKFTQAAAAMKLRSSK
jgi:hypothetical protein